MIVMAASKQNGNERPDVAVADPCQPKDALNTFFKRPAKRLFGVGRRNALDVPFSTGRSRVVCRAGVI